MKKVIFLFLIIFSGVFFAQTKTDDNVFKDTENQNNTSKNTTTDPGAPGDPVPINEYVPFLVLSGMVAIVYYQKKQTKLNLK